MTKPIYVDVTLINLNIKKMKNLKTICILFLSVLIISCSKKDDNTEQSAPEASFTGIVNGGPFSNYTAKLGSYSTETNVGLTLAVIDANGNTIRLFMNQTGGFSAGTVKVIDNVDGDGFITNALIHHSDSQATFYASEGNLTISENRATPGAENSNIISGSFTLTLTDNLSTTLTLNGTFNNFQYNTY